MIFSAFSCKNESFKKASPIGSTPEKIEKNDENQNDQIEKLINVELAYYASISPDGKLISFISERSGNEQIWITRADSLVKPVQYTKGKSVSFHKWLPDSRGILYGMDKEGNEKEGFYIISTDGKIDNVILPPIDAYRNFGDFNRTGDKFVYATTERNGHDSDIHIYDLKNNKDEKVYKGKLGYQAIDFSPDEQYLLIEEWIGEDANILYLLDMKTSELKPLIDENDRSILRDIKWIPGEDSFYLLTNTGREFVGLAKYDIGKRSMKDVLKLEKDIEEFQIDWNREEAHILANENGYTEHYIFDLRNQVLKDTIEWPRGRLSLDFAKDGYSAIMNVYTPHIPADVWRFDLQSREKIRLTQPDTSGINLTKMISPKLHSFKSRDGLEINGFLYQTENMDESSPLVINVHGGPTAQARPEYRPIIQYLVQNGISVFDLNYRGSTGYGKSFARANNLREREKELYDLEDAVKYLIQNDLANDDKIGIMGVSYGGYLTMAAMTRLPGTFNCGVTLVGVSDWISALEDAYPSLKASDRFEYGDIDNPDDRKYFESLSPINFIHQVEDPVMVLHGVNDPRVPVEQSDKFVKGIRENGGDVQYLRFSDEGHLIQNRHNQIEAYKLIVKFLEKNLGDEIKNFEY